MTACLRTRVEFTSHFNQLQEPSCDPVDVSPHDLMFILLGPDRILFCKYTGQVAGQRRTPPHGQPSLALPPALSSSRKGALASCSRWRFWVSQLRFGHAVSCVQDMSLAPSERQTVKWEICMPSVATSSRINAMMRLTRRQIIEIDINRRGRAMDATHRAA